MFLEPYAQYGPLLKNQSGTENQKQSVKCYVLELIPQKYNTEYLLLFKRQITAVIC